MHHDALLIDAMGTLVGLDAPAPVLAAELARRFGIAVDEATAGAALRAEIGFYREHMQDGRDAEAVVRLRARCAAVLQASLGPPLRGVAPAEMTEALLAALRFSAFPDARGALQRVRAAGARVVVVSNWDISLADVLERVGLAPLLHGVVTSAAVGARKPDRAIFHQALAVAGVGPGRAVHVGDSPSEDVAGARACGIRAVLLHRGAERGHGPDVIGGLDELAWPWPAGARGR